MREVMREQVRLNVALCEQSHTVADLKRELERVRKECDEWKKKYEERCAATDNDSRQLRMELKKIREDVEKEGCIPYDLLNAPVVESAEEPVVDRVEHVEDVKEEEEKNVVVMEQDKHIKRREYMKEYMKKKRVEKKEST